MNRRHMKCTVGVLIILVLSIVLAACVSNTDQSAEDSEGQNPAMNFVGDYVCDRATIHIIRR